MADGPDEKALAEVYAQRAALFMLAMAMAHKLGYKVGTRGDADWPVHFIVLPGFGEIAIHVSATDAVPVILALPKIDQQYDGHTDQQKHERILAFVQEAFSDP
jgi:hypothetical protein